MYLPRRQTDIFLVLDLFLESQILLFYIMFNIIFPLFKIGREKLTNFFFDPIHTNFYFISHFRTMHVIRYVIVSSYAIRLSSV